MAGIRNAMYVTCEGCFKTFAYEKDDDSPVYPVEVEPFRYENLCEKCAEGDNFFEDEDEDEDED